VADDVQTTDPDATLRPPQFTLRAMLIGTLLVAVLISLVTAVGTAWALGLLFFALFVAAHVVGNAVGTRLRDRAVVRPEIAAEMRRAASGGKSVVTHGPSRLGEHRRLHWFTLVLTLAGALTAGYFGGRALAANYPDATTAAVWLAHISSGVLGGLAVFVVSAFAMIVRQMLSEAHAGSDPYHPAGFREAKPIGPSQRTREE
jgi:hypothetical protein